jgi:hypothetical protein
MLILNLKTWDVTEFGCFLVWNRDGSNRARILVKLECLIFWKFLLAMSSVRILMKLVMDNYGLLSITFCKII